MKAEGVNVVEWQKRFGAEEVCAAAARRRWPNGFQCPRCGHDHGSFISTRHTYACCRCRYQVSLTAGTLFHSTNLPLTKWFWTIYLVASDKGGISAVRLSGLIGVSWITASRMLRKIRIAMGHRDGVYRLHDLIEIEAALIGGRRCEGKRGRGAEGKTPILMAVENREKQAGFIAMEQLPTVACEVVTTFVQRHIPPSQFARTDALASLVWAGKTQHHAARVTPPEKAGKWLPWVHIAIGNPKAFLLGARHDVSFAYLQEYLNEFFYRFNRRQWQPQLPLHLINACLTRIRLKMV